MAPVPSLSAEYAKRLLRDHVLQKYNAQHNLGRDNKTLPHRPLTYGPSDGPSGKICIIGAGTAGLQVALALLWCGITDFDILEATDHVVGRAHTITFPNDLSPACPHNYYDAGAMRIPDIPAMDSIMNMIRWLNLEDKKVPYTYVDGNEPTMYLYQSKVDSTNQAFKTAISNTVQPFLVNFDTAFENFLMGPLDNVSTRMWLMNMCSPPMTYGQTVVAETFDT